MPRFFFDTNIIRYFGQAFGAEQLPDDLRDRVVISPISLLEIISQLSLGTARQVFESIQAMWHWLPQRVGLLDYPPVALRRALAEEDHEGGEVFNRLQNAIQRCLYANNEGALFQSVKQLRQYLDAAKESNAREKKAAVEAMRDKLRAARKKEFSDDELRFAFKASIARRAGVHPDAVPENFLDRLDAYFAYDTTRLKRALQVPRYNFLSKKRQNDLFDSEQLIYLAHDDIHFITTDSGYKHLLGTIQGHRIHLITKESAIDRETAVEVLRAVA